MSVGVAGIGEQIVGRRGIGAHAVGSSPAGGADEFYWELEASPELWLTEESDTEDFAWVLEA